MEMTILNLSVFLITTSFCWNVAHVSSLLSSFSMTASMNGGRPPSSAFPSPPPPSICDAWKYNKNGIGWNWKAFSLFQPFYSFHSLSKTTSFPLKPMTISVKSIIFLCTQKKTLTMPVFQKVWKKADVVVIKASPQQEKKSGPAERKTLGNNEY